MLDLGSAVGRLLLDTSGFTSGFKTATSAVKTFQNQTATAGDKFAAMGSALTSVGGTLTKTVTLPLVGIGTAAVKTAADFESAMSRVIAITNTDLYGTEKTYDMLKDAAMEWGAKTKYSASEAADALYYMSLAGWDVNESIAGLPGVLSLAAASGMELGAASDIVTDFLTAFGLEADYATQMADMMAYAQANANTTTQMLADAYGNCAVQAHSFGVTLEETTAYLSKMADSGLKGSEAGTALNAVFRDITQKMEDGKIQIGETAIAIEDASGNFRSLTDIIEDINKATEGMGSAQKAAALYTTFTSRSYKGLSILLDAGADSLREFTNELYNSSGTAGDQMNEMLNNLSGQLTILKSTFETLMITIGDMLMPTIKSIVKWLQDLTNYLNSLDESQKRTIITIAEIAAAIGPLLLIVGKFSMAISSIIGLVGGTGGLSAALTALTGPIGVVIAAVAALAIAWATDFGGIREKTAEIFDAISETINYYLDIIKNAWENDLYGIRTTAEDIWNTITNLFKLALDAITSIFKIFAAAFRGDWSTVWTEVKNLASTVWEAIKTLIKGALNLIVDLLVNIAAKLYSAALTSWNKIKEAATKAWDGLMSWFKKALDDPVKAVTDIGMAMFNAGKSILNSLWDGVKSIWGSIAGWFQEKANWVKNLFAGIKNTVRGATSSASGSYASGLDYVTHDRVVQVHEGEGILTKEENAEYRSGKRNSGGDTYNFYSPKALNPTTAAREMRKAKQQLALGVV